MGGAVLRLSTELVGAKFAILAVLVCYYSIKKTLRLFLVFNSNNMNI